MSLMSFIVKSGRIVSTPNTFAFEDGSSITWQPDGSVIVYCQDGSTLIYDRDGLAVGPTKTLIEPGEWTQAGAAKLEIEKALKT